LIIIQAIRILLTFNKETLPSIYDIHVYLYFTVLFHCLFYLHGIYALFTLIFYFFLSTSYQTASLMLLNNLYFIYLCNFYTYFMDILHLYLLFYILFYSNFIHQRTLNLLFIFSFILYAILFIFYKKTRILNLPLDFLLFLYATFTYLHLYFIFFRTQLTLVFRVLLAH